jgi:hypothetical protein
MTATFNFLHSDEFQVKLPYEIKLTLCLDLLIIRIAH